MSKPDKDFDRRLCRLDGLKPTARDRWTAFYRLWRIAQGHGAHQDMAADLCFRVLLSDWRWIRLLDGRESDGLVDRSRVPMFLRKKLLDIHRKQRLYAGHYEWQERDKKVAHLVREQHGLEVTPTEVAETRRKVIQLARAKAAEMDYAIPDDDEELLKLLNPNRGGD